MRARTGGVRGPSRVGAAYSYIGRSYASAEREWEWEWERNVWEMDEGGDVSVQVCDQRTGWEDGLCQGGW